MTGNVCMRGVLYILIWQKSIWKKKNRACCDQGYLTIFRHRITQRDHRCANSSVCAYTSRGLAIVLNTKNMVGFDCKTMSKKSKNVWGKWTRDRSTGGNGKWPSINELRREKSRILIIPDGANEDGIHCSRRQNPKQYRLIFGLFRSIHDQRTTSKNGKRFLREEEAIFANKLKKRGENNKLEWYAILK